MKKISKLFVTSWFLLVGSAIQVEAVSAQAPEVTLSSQIKKAGKRLVATISPSSDASQCTYLLYGASSKSKLSGNGKGSELFSVGGAATPTKIVADNLKQLSGSGTQKLFLQSEVLCADGSPLTQSPIRALSLERKSGGTQKSTSGWFKDVKNKLNNISISLSDAFPALTFSSPLGLYSANDGTNRIFVVEQGGLIKVFNNSSSISTTNTFLDLSSLVSSGGEQGLLGLAFHPNYQSNGLFFVSYTDSTGDSVVARYHANSGSDLADAGSAMTILTVDQPFTNHNGGAIVFGNDGFLYLALGDGGSGGDPLDSGQDRTSLLGKILRIDIDNTEGSNNYAIPSTNPFKDNDSGFKEEIFAYGFRNPWRISFDRQTGNLWAGDVGQATREEVDIVTNGANYGWKVREGKICYSPPSGCSSDGFTEPLYDYGRDLGGSITGGYVYRGSLIPQLKGAYIFGDFSSGRIFSLREEGLNKVQVTELKNTDLLISSFGEDEAQELYVVSYGDGKIYKIS